MASSDATSQGRQPPRILIHLPTVSYFGAVLRIAETLAQNGLGEVIIYAASRFPGYDDLKTQTDRAGVYMLCARGADLKPISDVGAEIATLGLAPQGVKRARSTIDQLRARGDRGFDLRLWLLRSLAGPQWRSTYAGQYQYWLNAHAAAASRADTVIDALDVDLFITCNETLNYNAQVFIASMHARGRRCLYVPLSVPSANEMEGWLSSEDEARVVDRCQRVAMRLFPKWARTVRGTPLLRVPVGRLLALERDGLAPREPWLSFTLGSDAVGISSPFLLERLLELGASYRRDRMFLLGSPEDAELNRDPAHAHALRAEIAARFGWDATKPILLFSPSADLTRQYALPEYGAYAEMLDAWARSFTALRNFNVLVSPHPWFRINEPARRVLENTGLAILWRKAVELMPAVDAFAAFGASSTPGLAAAMGLPVLNYLCFDARIPPGDDKSYFVGFDSMPVARNRAEWNALLATVDDPAKFAELRARARARAAYFGLQDGAFARRLGDMVTALTAGSGAFGADEAARLRARLKA